MVLRMNRWMCKSLGRAGEIRPIWIYGDNLSASGIILLFSAIVFPFPIMLSSDPQRRLSVAPTWTPKTLSNFVFRVSLAPTWENHADLRSLYFLISINGNWWMCSCVLVSATRIASFINYKASTNQKVFSGVWDSSEHILLYRCKTNGTLAQKEQHINHHKPLVCLLLDMVSTPRNTTWWLVCFDASMQLVNMLLLVVTGRIVHWLGNYFERTI